VCDLENVVNEEAIPHVGLQHHVKKNYNTIVLQLPTAFSTVTCCAGL
jgi:hypothetical protein